MKLWDDTRGLGVANWFGRSELGHCGVTRCAGVNGSLSLFWGLRGHSMGVGIASWSRSTMAGKCGVADGLRRLDTEIVPDSLGMRSC